MTDDEALADAILRLVDDQMHPSPRWLALRDRIIHRVRDHMARNIRYYELERDENALLRKRLQKAEAELALLGRFFSLDDPCRECAPSICSGHYFHFRE